MANVSVTRAGGGTLFLILGALVLVGSMLGGWWMHQPSAHPPRAKGENGSDATGSQTTTQGNPKQDKLIARGRFLYRGTCVHCHGPEGHGDGPVAATLKTSPRDFVRDSWKHGTSAESIRRVIRNGIPGSEMPGSPTLSLEDLDALVSFVQALAPHRREEISALPSSVKTELKKLSFQEVLPRPAPSLTLQSVAGERIRLSDLRGRYVFLHFWTSTCVSCIAELPSLAGLLEKLSSSGPAIVSLCLLEQDNKNAREALQKLAGGAPIYVSTNPLTQPRFNVQLIPSILLIDPQGRIVATASGIHPWKEERFRNVLAKLTSELGSSPSGTGNP